MVSSFTCRGTTGMDGTVNSSSINENTKITTNYFYKSANIGILDKKN